MLARSLFVATGSAPAAAADLSGIWIATGVEAGDPCTESFQLLHEEPEAQDGGRMVGKQLGDSDMAFYMDGKMAYGGRLTLLQTFEQGTSQAEPAEVTAPAAPQGSVHPRLLAPSRTTRAPSRAMMNNTNDCSRVERLPRFLQDG